MKTLFQYAVISAVVFLGAYAVAWRFALSLPSESAFTTGFVVGGFAVMTRRAIEEVFGK